jgi:putative glutamine amidotransferase
MPDERHSPVAGSSTWKGARWDQPIPPLIGVTGARARTSRVSGMPELLLGGAVDIFHAAYGHAVRQAGGIPVLVSRDAKPQALVNRLDGLVIAGGDDVDPRRYGGRPGPHTSQLDPDRDSFESELIDTAIERRLPILGICRGCQLMNVARGGTLIDHLALDVGEAHGQLAYPLHSRVHALRYVPGGLSEQILPPGTYVNSFHHQAVDSLGSDVKADAFALDGICEALTIGDLALGVQWHPEYFRDQPDPTFTWLVDQARAIRKTEDTATDAGFRSTASPPSR